MKRSVGKRLTEVEVRWISGFCYPLVGKFHPSKLGLVGLGREGTDYFCGETVVKGLVVVDAVGRNRFFRIFGFAVMPMAVHTLA